MLRILAALLCLVSAASAQDIGGGIINTGRGGGAPSGTLTINTTPISGGTNGRCLYDNNGFLSEIACSPLTAGTTPTAGIVSGNVLGSSGNLLVDTGVAYNALLTALTVGTTPVTGAVSGNLLANAGGVLTDSGVSPTSIVSKIIAGTTPTQGFVDGDLLYSFGSVVADTGIAASTIGTVTSVSAGCGSSTGAGAITTAGTVVTTEPPVTLTGANVPIITGYCGETIYLNNGSAQTPTIAQAGSTGFPSGYYVDICNIGAGAQALTPATSTIGGAASYSFAAGTAAAPICARVISDGTNYLIALAGGGGGSSGANPTATAGPTAVNGSASTFLRSDGAPAVQQGSAAQKGIVQVDGTTVTAASGVISAVSAGTTNASPISHYITNNYYSFVGIPPGQAAANGAAANGTMLCSFGGVTQSVTIKSLGLYVSSAGAGGTLGQLAIYSVGATTATYIDSTATFAISAATTVETGALNNTTDTLSPGTLYMICVNQNGTPTYAGTNGANSGVNYLAGTATAGNLLNTATSSAINSRSIASTFNCSSSCTNGFPNSITLSSMADVLNTKAPSVAFLVN